MNGFSVAFVFAIALIATTHGNYAEGSGSATADADSSYAAPAPAPAPAPNAAGYNSNSYSSYGDNQKVLPYSAANTRGGSVSSSISYPQNKGEILIHRPAAIIVKRPPTRVLVNHPPLVVKPAPVVLHKPPAVVVRKVFVKQHPRKVNVEPVYVNVVKPPAENYFVNDRQQHHYLPAPKPAYHAPSGDYNAPSSGYNAPGAGYKAADAAGASAGDAASGLNEYNSQPDYSGSNDGGYQLVQGGQGLAALANIGQAASNYAAPASSY